MNHDKIDSLVTKYFPSNWKELFVSFFLQIAGLLSPPGQSRWLFLYKQTKLLYIQLAHHKTIALVACISYRQPWKICVFSFCFLLLDKDQHQLYIHKFDDSLALYGCSNKCMNPLECIYHIHSWIWLNN